MMFSGPEFGGAIGLMFVLAQSMAVAMHLIGFCESFLDMLNQVSLSYLGIG
jgi:solute carrier family 12 sodium/potassium/chloride transporter 2